MNDRPRASGYAAGVVVVSLSTLFAWFVFGREALQEQLADVVMTYLLGVVIVSMRFGYGPSLIAAVLSVVSFEFFFIPPIFSFRVSDLRHSATFAVMFVVAIVVSSLTKRIRDQADAAKRRERNTATLYATSREFGQADSREALLESAARHVRATFDAKVAVFLPSRDDAIEAVLADEDFMSAPQGPESGAAWAWKHQRPAGVGMDLLPSAAALFVPLNGSRGRVGVLGLLPAVPGQVRDSEELRLLETFAGLIGSALERTTLAEEARQATLRVETEQLRNALLSSVSHDLRTPLAVVTGATSTLLGDHAPTDEAKRRTLIMTAHEEALRLNRLVRNLLDMTRLDAGALKVKKELQPLEEVVGAALYRLDDRLRGRPVGTDLPTDLPLVPFDSVLIEQVLINLIENATKHSPAGGAIDIAARAVEGEVEVEIADRGPGVDRENAERVFEKFYRVREGEGGGVGLGLTICRGIVSAHKGRIWVSARPQGGASFRFTLPLESGHEAGPERVSVMS